MGPELPAGTVTFLFTDIEGSTRLLHALGPERYAGALVEHRRALREAFAEHSGVEVDTQGDAFLVAFPTAPGAAAAARAANEALGRGPIRVRMGLHTGAPLVTGEGYVGVDVHRGARVGSLAHGGQVVVSPTTAALLEGEPLRDLGLHRLKDFDGASRLFQLGDGQFPPLRTPGSVDLPTPATRFLGREQELFDAVSLVLDRDPRVLTIVGPGGTGKTRFAIELARLLAEEADGATLFVALAPLRDSGLLLPAVAEKLGTPSAEPTALAAATGARRTHLVLDNAEHLLPQASARVAELVAAAPSVHVLVTSREPLRIQGEVELDLPPLVGEEAVTLFVERARAVRPDTTATPAIGELCERLDRLPLALELAAARTKVLAPEQLLERIGQRLDLLTGTRDADERHATLRATIGWSYELLEPQEQRLFERMSVFVVGCTIESAEAVCDADVETLASLLDKSLLRRRTGRLSEERYWMLETIREFASERLAGSGEGEEIRRRHAERMLDIARAAHLSEDDDEPFELAAALAERDDMRAALDWAAEMNPELGLQIAVALETFWNAHAPREGVIRVSDLLERAGPLRPELEARALRVHGNTASLSGDSETAKSRWEQSLTLFRDLGDDRGTAGILHRLALEPLVSRAYEHAKELVDESQELARGRFRLVEIVNLHIYAELAKGDGRVQDAFELERRSAEMAHEIGWSWWESGRRDVLTRLALRLGRLDDAEHEGRTALAIEVEQENRVWAVHTLSGLAQVALARDDMIRAGLLWGAAEAEVERVPAFGFPARSSKREERSGALLHETRAEFAAAVADGRRLDLWDAAAIALGEDDQTVP